MNLRPLLLTLPVAAVLGLAAANAPRTPAASPASAPAAWAIDTVHSFVNFRVMRGGTTWAYGRFNEFSGSIDYDAAAPEKAKVEVTISTESVDTANGKRDGHLKSPDFFDAKQFPTATFKSTKVEKKGDKLAVSGDLSLRGVTKPATIEVEVTGTGEARGTPVVGFLGQLAIDRHDFGISYGPDALGKEVHLTFSIEAVAKK